MQITKHKFYIVPMIMARAGFHQNGPVIEVADILRRHGQDYARAHPAHLGRVERRVMSAIMACRTAALGGNVEWPTPSK